MTIAMPLPRRSQVAGGLKYRSNFGALRGGRAFCKILLAPTSRGHKKATAAGGGGSSVYRWLDAEARRAHEQARAQVLSARKGLLQLDISQVT